MSEWLKSDSAKVLMLVRFQLRPQIFSNMSCCKECPWKVENNHNQKLKEFVNRTGRKHTCHIVNPKLWDTSNEKQICKGIEEIFV